MVRAQVYEMRQPADMQRMCALRQVPRKYALVEQQVADYDGIVVELIA